MRRNLAVKQEENSWAQRTTVSYKKTQFFYQKKNWCLTICLSNTEHTAPPTDYYRPSQLNLWRLILVGRLIKNFRMAPSSRHTPKHVSSMFLQTMRTGARLTSVSKTAVSASLCQQVLDGDRNARDCRLIIATQSGHNLPRVTSVQRHPGTSLPDPADLHPMQKLITHQELRVKSLRTKTCNETRIAL